MTATGGFAESTFLRGVSLAIATTILVIAIVTPPADALTRPHLQTLRGTVEGNGAVQPGYTVSLYASYLGGLPYDRILGTATTDSAGKFKIRYRLPHWLPYWLEPLLFVTAKDGPVMLAGAIGNGPHQGDVVVNELTTVATATAFAQFVDGRKIRGNTYGMLNAVKIAANMASAQTGNVGQVLSTIPNGTDTSTYPTFNSLANAVASCVAADTHCHDLFAATTPPGGPPPTTVLQAIANVAKYPSYPNYPMAADDPLFQLSLLNNTYQPALTERPTNWLLFLKFTGGFYSDYADTNLLNGPGQVAIDERGYFWINDNYVPVNPTGDPTHPYEVACAGKRLLKFYPWGEPYAGMPIETGYTGGGLSGAGFGITLDPRGNVWVGNFGFEAPICADDPLVAAPHDSVSLFRPNGNPLSGPNGFTRGHIWWPQATMSDRKSNIWIANCGNDTVTMIPRGNPWRARNIPLPGGLGADGIYQPVYSESDPDTQPRLKPFAITIDPKGRAWVTGNFTGDNDVGDPIGAVYRIWPNGYVETLPDTTTDTKPKPLFSRPMGIVGDSKGNIWVSNSDAVSVPCVDPFTRHAGGNPSVAFISPDGNTRHVYTGGGLTVPWGSAVDGDDTVWVFNFNDHLDEGDDDPVDYPLTALSRFCGIGECPAGLIRGDPISPETGYMTDALDRVTGGAIGPSGAIVILNNWKLEGPRPAFYNTSPGGNSFVIVPGAAAPIRTPLIGPPQSFDRHHHLAFDWYPPYWDHW